ncbi:hypothetical protein B0H15DRAFT_132024 [Mycena belliarum]|uniref:ER membrane protein complex subunit 10 n=1 Tax=Mycena belliarum TaxID=1033014 RepID=A0AAD6XUX0_9AGAR|nr:hypothetical protein B0H15DRAFT_132024 [Mycena belliae]
MSRCLNASAMLLPFVLATASASLAWAADSSFQIYHRIYEPTQPETAFTPRGTVLVPANGDPSFRPSQTLAQDLTQFATALQTVKGALYQVALEREGAGAAGQWDIASAVKVCHLHQATSETILLHTTLGNTPFALDYFVAPIPHNGACPKSSKAPSPLLSFAGNVAELNTTVVLKSPRLPPLPELRVPPPLTPEGEPVVPVPEKSLFQRYWMYGLAILVALMLSGGPEEESGKK